MSNKIDPRVLKGFRDSLPPEEINRKMLISRLEEAFVSFGFLPIDTPVLEYTEVLLGKGGGETDKQIYRFEDHGKRDVSLRFDLTVPFARFISKNKYDLYLPFKRYHISKVWRGENTQKGRYREFYQCDFDTVGTTSVSADLDILLLMQHSLKLLGIDNFSIHINNRGLFNRLLEKMDIAGKSVELLRTVDKMPKIGKEKTLELLMEIIPESTCRILLDFISPENDWKETLAKMENLSGGPSTESARLRELLTALNELSLEKHFRLAPAITRGLDYYTGVVFETFIDGYESFGSVCSGGRYDNLTALFTKDPLPGVGASIGLDRLLAVMEEMTSGVNNASPIELCIFNLDDGLLAFYHKTAAELRLKGINCEVYPENRKIAQQFKFAESKNIPFAVICGEDEVKSGTISLKNLATKESLNNIQLAEAVEYIRKSL